METRRHSAETQELDQTAALTFQIRDALLATDHASSVGRRAGATDRLRTGCAVTIRRRLGVPHKLGQERRVANSSTLKMATPVSVEKFYIETRSASSFGCGEAFM
jgi:hypothetical protein